MKVILSSFISVTSMGVEIAIYNSATGETFSAKPEGTELNWTIPTKASGEYLHISSGNSGYSGESFYLFQYCGAVYCVQNGWERKVCSIPITHWFYTPKVKIFVDSHSLSGLNISISIAALLDS